MSENNLLICARFSLDSRTLTTLFRDPSTAQQRGNVPWAGRGREFVQKVPKQADVSVTDRHIILEFVTAEQAKEWVQDSPWWSCRSRSSTQAKFDLFWRDEKHREVSRRRERTSVHAGLRRTLADAVVAPMSTSNESTRITGVADMRLESTRSRFRGEEPGARRGQGPRPHSRSRRVRGQSRGPRPRRDRTATDFNAIGGVLDDSA